MAQTVETTSDGVTIKGEFKKGKDFLVVRLPANFSAIGRVNPRAALTKFVMDHGDQVRQAFVLDFSQVQKANERVMVQMIVTRQAAAARNTGIFVFGLNPQVYGVLQQPITQGLIFQFVSEAAAMDAFEESTHK